MIPFYKYHGTGNDFVLIDNRAEKYTITPELVKQFAHRRFGIGADGVMALKRHPKYDFEMEYYNPDGSSGMMCGNGGRSIVAFAKNLGIIGEKTTFLATDGLHEAFISSENIVKLKMLDVQTIKTIGDAYFMNTGTVHYIHFFDSVEDIDIVAEGRKIRYDKQFAPIGTNVNFVSINENDIFVRTYEKGVEDETYSCGTGVTASAISVFLKTGRKDFDVMTKGGKLKVYFDYVDNKFINVWLEGKATFVFEGKI